MFLMDIFAVKITIDMETNSVIVLTCDGNSSNVDCWLRPVDPPGCKLTLSMTGNKHVHSHIEFLAKLSLVVVLLFL